MSLPGHEEDVHLHVVGVDRWQIGKQDFDRVRLKGGRKHFKAIPSPTTTSIIVSFIRYELVFSLGTNAGKSVEDKAVAKKGGGVAETLSPCPIAVRRHSTVTPTRSVKATQGPNGSKKACPTHWVPCECERYSPPGPGTLDSLQGWKLISQWQYGKTSIADAGAACGKPACKRPVVMMQARPTCRKRPGELLKIQAVSFRQVTSDG